MGRPGILIYFDLMGPMNVLSYEEKGRLFEAMLQYGKYGNLPEFEGMLALAWGFVKPELDKDEEAYERTVAQRQYAAYCKRQTAKNLPKESFDEWMVSTDNDRKRPITTDNDRKRPMDLVASRYPTTITNTITNTTSITNTNTSTCAGGDAVPPSERKDVFGKYKNVWLTQSEYDSLMAEVPGAMDWIEKLSGYIASSGKQYDSHYATIRNWEAKEKREAPKRQNVNKFNDMESREWDYDALERASMQQLHGK